MQLQREVQQRKHDAACGVGLIENMALRVQATGVVPKKKHGYPPRLLLDAGEKDFEVRDVLVEAIDVDALSAALAMTAAVEEVDGVSPLHQGAHDLGVPSEVFGVTVDERDVSGRIGGALGMPEEPDAVARAEETLVRPLVRHAGPP